MDTDDLPPVLEPIQVDFSRMVGVAAPGGMEVGLEPAPEPEPEAKPEAPRQATEEAVGQRQLEPLVSGSVTAEDSPLPGQSGLTFDQMVERALSESGGSPFGGHLQAQRPPSGQTSENVRSPVILGDETQPNTPQSCDVDKEMQEFIGLEERLRRGDELTEEEQLLCRTPSAVSARNAVAANVSSKESSRVQPPDTQIDAALVWAGLDADSPPDRDHPTAAECVSHLTFAPPSSFQLCCLLDSHSTVPPVCASESQYGTKRNGERCISRKESCFQPRSAPSVSKHSRGDVRCW